MGVGALNMSRGSRRAVFLDRDGVINQAIVIDGRPFSPQSPGELHLLPGVPAACTRLKAAGFLLIVATNQPDIANHKTTRERVDELNQILKDQLPLDDVFVCPHNDQDNCACRKPKPGLLTAAAARWQIDLAASFMVGDRWRDVDAGRAAGCRTVFIDHGYSERRPTQPDIVTASLLAAAPSIIAAPGGSS
jgi:D-glycero-D-manno-heptose 1,7-bisphosphate phosphatase